MIRLLIIIVALLAGLIFAPELSANRGYLLISFDRYTTYETTIINAGFIVLILYVMLLALEWLLRKLLSMSSVTRGWLGQRKSRQAQKNSLLGMLALLEGNTKQAEKLLAKSAAHSDSPALNYIAAARASHKNLDYKQRDIYLNLANKAPGCKLAVGLVQVELQINAQQFEEAFLTLKKLDADFPKNKQICQYYLVIYPGLNEWKKLISLLNSHRKLLDLSDKALLDLELQAHQKLFLQLAAKNGALLESYWDTDVSRVQRKELSYQKAILSAYIENGCGKLAQSFLLDKLKHHFSLPLLSYIQQIKITDHYALITFLEKQLKNDQYAAYIHQALGHLKLKENHPQAAIEHFIESVKTLPNVTDYEQLASLLSTQGRTEEANEYYREGLTFAVQKPDDEAQLPVTTHESSLGHL